MPRIPVDDLATKVENAVFTAVGLGILGFQHVQVQRREISRQVSAVVRSVGEQVERTLGGR
ncbi:MAG TPA: hypothetical protein VFZ77_17785 [Acidimicrobiales bacterium]